MAGRRGTYVEAARGLVIVRLSKKNAHTRPYPREEVALKAYAEKGQKVHEVLGDLLPGIFVQLLEGGTPEADLAVEAMNLIGKNYAPPKFVADEKWRGPDTGEVQELASFVTPEEIEQALAHVRRCGLTPRELELCKILLENPGISNREAGESLGMSSGAVASLKSRIRNTPGITRIA